MKKTQWFLNVITNCVRQLLSEQVTCTAFNFHFINQGNMLEQQCVCLVKNIENIANMYVSPSGHLFSPSKRKKRFEGEKWCPEGEKHKCKRVMTPSAAYAPVS